MNNAIFFFFYNLAHQSNLFDNLIIFLAVYFPFVAVILAGLFLLFHHEILRAENPFRVFLEKKKEILVVFFSSFLAYFLASILKILFHTTRPFLAFPNINALFSESSYAFPSGHAAFFSALAFSIFFLHKKAGYVFIFFALLIGVARIVAGVHFPIDILGGFILGGTISYLVAYFVKSV
ncbi:MAG: phosphatase PAP2 family protein [Candidatus Paceibacterota bacterium]